MQKQPHEILSLTRQTALVIFLSSIAACASTGGPSPTESSEAVISSEQTIERGDQAARRGEFDRALALYLRATEVEESSAVWFRVGAAAARLDNSERALQAYLRALQLEPDHAGAHEAAGLRYIELDDLDAGFRHLIRALELDPFSWRAHNGLGVIADREQDYGTAIGHYSAALEINPDSAMLLNNLGYSRYLAGDFDQAARDMYRATEVNTNYAPAWSNLGMIYAQQAWYDEAVNMLARVTDKASAYNDVGYVAFRKGDLLRAEQLLSEAVRLSPTYYPTANQNLSLIRSKLRNQQQGAQLTFGSFEISQPARETEDPKRVISAADGS